MAVNELAAQKALHNQTIAKEVVETIINNICGRKGFDKAFDLDEDILDEIELEMMESIISGMN